MAKDKMDPVIEYLIALGINPADGLGSVRKQLEKASDCVTANKVINLIRGRNDFRLNDNESFYPIKNETYKLSLALSSAYDGDILKKACRWILNHQEMFGDNILEIGCDCGIVSCFLAKTFSTAQITAIDRCQEGINNAKILARKLGVENVQFLCADVKAISKQYDTVFSMRTVHENHTQYVENDQSMELEEQALLFKDSLLPYAYSLSSKLKEDGLLVSIERIGRNSLLLGWMQALEEAGLSFNLDVYEELNCKEVGEDSTFEALVSYKAAEKKSSAFELFMDACTKYMDFTLPQYEGWAAKIIFAFKHGELVDGFIAEDPIAQTRNKLSIWTHKFDDTCLIMYQNNNGNVFAGFYDISQMAELKEELERAENEIRNQKWMKITKM